MAVVRVRCNKCARLVTRQQAEYSPAGLPCSYAPCDGTMFKEGRALTSQKTIQGLPSYEKAQERVSRQRGTKRSYVDMDDEEEDKSGDADFAPSLVFKPSMRFTDDPMQVPRTQEELKAAAYVSQKGTDLVDITAAIPGERSKETRKEFGGTSAWQWAKAKGAPNAATYIQGGKRHYEWCHLHADTLGGRCTASNLVAGHFALNTCMMTIESYLSGRTDLQIEVVAYCRKDDVADHVFYGIYRRTQGDPVLVWSRLLDGQEVNFSKKDYKSLYAELGKAVPKKRA
jgi:hypothetical protein